jgi:mannose-6-phosphate isomerase
MGSVFKLENKVKNYDWGSMEWIPRFLDVPNDTRMPWAELWMGVHPEGSSSVVLPGQAAPEETIGLPELLSRAPERYLGPSAVREFGGLPFLYKLLAAGRPLSIQAHPDLNQAKAGWERENALGIPLNAFNRNYKDPNHKPEILCALTPFTAMAGFREPEALIRRLRAFGFPPLKPLLTALEAGAADNGRLGNFLESLFALSPETRRTLTQYACSQKGALQDASPEFAEEWRYTAYFAELYPGDPGIIAPLYLNLMQLNPEEAIYIPAGILHAYVSGFGVELMANSDNVLRGGLTPKYVDLKELTGILQWTPFKPEILRPRELAPRLPGGASAPIPGDADTDFVHYPVPCREFSLFKMTGKRGRTPFPESGPVILIVSDGQLHIAAEEGEELSLKRGESVFIAARNGTPLVFSGNYTLFAAGTGLGGA